MSPATKASREELERTRNVVQYAHDYVEMFGFNIGEIGPRKVDPDLDPEWRDDAEVLTDVELKAIREGRLAELKGAELVPCCFIGAARLGAGVDPGEYLMGTDIGDGPELTEALKLMDEFAIKGLRNHLGDDAGQYLDHDYDGLRALGTCQEFDEPGRKAEAIGFALRKRAAGNSYVWSAQTVREVQDFAIGTFRAILTDLDGQITAAS